MHSRRFKYSTGSPLPTTAGLLSQGLFARRLRRVRGLGKVCTNSLLAHISAPALGAMRT